METRELTAVETETVSGGAMTIDFGYVTLTFNFAREGAAYLPTSSAEICDNSHHCTSRNPRPLNEIARCRLSGDAWR